VHAPDLPEGGVDVAELEVIVRRDVRGWSR
jgi:hypothetical protein